MKTRLQRYLADCGVASRRACEEMILAGRVSVNGEVRTTMPVLIEPGEDAIAVDGRPVAGETGSGSAEQKKVYLLLNKPKGILVTSRDPADRKTVGELISGIKERVFPVGRLDMDSRGALLMTNDGELANRLTHPRYGVEKTYVVEVDGRLGHEDLERIKRGMWLGPEHPAGHGGVRTERFHIRLLGRERGRTIVEVRISEARNREIRRVMARLGHPVRDLNRVAIAGKVTLKGLPVGEHRPLTAQEVEWLFHASSPEYHDRHRAATQAWYEAKEMEKERRRLAAETRIQGAGSRDIAPRETGRREKKEFRPRPARKGRKPFVPPSGRNAGKALGGNARGLQDRPPKEHEAQAVHPLGDQARADD